VPEYLLGRLYRDALGRFNQQVAAAADAAYFLIAGLPLDLKALACSPLPQ
jgi:adenosylcobinamide kinase/adenosylcobinamide-phosphate guanylyltransferase